MGKGLSFEGAPVFLAQYSASVRSAKSTILTDQPDKGHVDKPGQTKRNRGSRIHYSLSLTRLSDGIPIYTMRAEGRYKPRKTPPQTLAEQFCSAVREQPSGRIGTDR